MRGKGREKRKSSKMRRDRRERESLKVIGVFLTKVIDL